MGRRRADSLIFDLLQVVADSSHHGGGFTVSLCLGRAVGLGIVLSTSFHSLLLGPR